MKSIVRKRNRSSPSVNDQRKTKRAKSVNFGRQFESIDRLLWSERIERRSSDLDSTTVEIVRAKISNRKEFTLYLATYVISTLIFCFAVKFCHKLIKCKMTGVFELEMVDLFDFSKIWNLFGLRRRTESIESEVTHFSSSLRILRSVFLYSNLLQIVCLCLLHRMVEKGHDITTKSTINSFTEFTKEIIFYSSAAQLIQLFLPLVWWIHVLLLLKGLFMLHSEYSWRLKYIIQRKIQHFSSHPP